MIASAGRDLRDWTRLSEIPFIAEIWPKKKIIKGCRRALHYAAGNAITFSSPCFGREIDQNLSASSWKWLFSERDPQSSATNP
jgi:hypothetical protein